MHSAKHKLREALQAWREQEPNKSLRLALTIDAADLASADEAAALGALLNACGELTPAHLSFERAWRLAPERFDLKQSYAGALTAAGRFIEAEDILTRAANQRPENAQIWFALANNRKQTREHNSIEKIQTLLTAESIAARDQVFLHYALGKCLEDIEDYERAFTHFEAGAHLRRSQIRYDIGPDINGMIKLRELFTEAALMPGHADILMDQHPVFIIGLPRSGTTLFERIISAHSEVGSIGEAATLTHALSSLLSQANQGQRLTREQAVENSMLLDPGALGKAYLEGIAPRTHGHLRIVDKMPLNFLYVGLIRRSLPQAKIILVRRGALDNCCAIFTTLFRQAYPFSYSFDELSAYYAEFENLARHWLEVCGSTILSVDYEAVTANIESEARRIIDYLELPWQDSCLSFHKNPTPTATASATQVRSPIYQSSVGRWRRFEGQLEPLKQALENHGVLA